MIEKTVQYSTTVSDLSETWAFIFNYVEEMGGRPKIIIEPVVVYEDDEEPQEQIEVTIACLTMIDDMVKAE